MIYEVVVKQKTSSQCFDYKSEQNLDRGQLVKVPFGKKTVLGVIFTKKARSDHKPKDIKKVLTKKPLINANQFEFAQLLSQEYISPLSESIFSFIPQFADKNLSTFDYSPRSSQTRNGFSTLVNLGTAKGQLTKIKERIKSGGQFLIVLPRITDCEQVKEFLHGENLYVYNSKLSETDKIKIFSLLLGGENIIVLATRAGCLLPFSNLKTVFMFDPANFAYQEDQEPRYNGEKAIYLMSKTYGASLEYCSTSFDVFTYTGYKKKLITLTNNINYPKIVVINSKDILCDSIIQKITKNSDENRKTLLVIPNTDFLFCKKCKIPLSCDKCKAVRIDGTGMCKSCKTRVVVACKKCSGSDFEGSRFNSKTIQDELISFKKVFVKTENELEDLDLDTEFSTVVYYSNDYMLRSSSYGSRLRLALKLRKILNFSPREITIITQSEQDKFWQNIFYLNQDKFFAEELFERKQNNLPPFVRLIKIKISKASKADDETIDELKSMFESIDTENGTLLFVPLDSTSKHKTEQTLAKLKSAKYFIDPIDLD